MGKAEAVCHWPGAHGENGFGGAHFDLTASPPHDIPGYSEGVQALGITLPDENTPAAVALVQLARQLPSQSLDVVAVGPLTNVALALLLDPTLPSKARRHLSSCRRLCIIHVFWRALCIVSFAQLRSLRVMGGATHLGNVTMTAEFNFNCDADAAHIVLEHFVGYSSKLVIAPWELCFQHSLTWKQFDQVREFGLGSSLCIP